GLDPRDHRAHHGPPPEADGRRPPGGGPLPRRPAMSSPVAFRAAYSSALADYLLHPSEASLRAAYELARDAVSRHLSVLDVAVAHQEALLSALGGAPDAAEVERVAHAAGDFFLEALS